jgi:hypothetical protein
MKWGFTLDFFFVNLFVSEISIIFTPSVLGQESKKHNTFYLQHYILSTYETIHLRIVIFLADGP